MKLYLIRHAQTELNRRGAYMGATDEGLRTAVLAEMRGITAPAAAIVIASPMLRCVQTATALYPEREIAVIDALRECDFGLFEGMTHSEIIATAGFESWGMSEEQMDFPQGESRSGFISRATNGFRSAYALAASQNAASAAIVTHGGVIMAVMHSLADEKGFYDYACANLCGYSLSFDGEKMTDVNELCLL